MINKIKLQTPKRTVEVSVPPDAYIVDDKDWPSLLASISPVEAMKMSDPTYPLEVDGVRVFRKSRVIEIK